MENKLQVNLKNFFYTNYVKYKQYHKNKYRKFYNKILNILTKELNKVHHITYTKKQWSIILGPWLTNILNIYFFYKFNFQNFNYSKFSKELKNQSSTELKKFRKDHLTYNDFVKNWNSKELHYSAINLIINKNINKYIKIKKIRFSYISLIKYFYIKFLKLIFNKKIILISKSRFNLKDQFLIVFKSKFKVFPLPVMESLFKFKFVNLKESRGKFFERINKNSKNFEILKFLFVFMPSAYLENFKFLKKLGEKHLLVPNKFYTDSTHLFDEILKIQLSEWSENNYTQIIIGQHGGNTKIYEDSFLNFNDYLYCNKFVTWGSIKTRKKEIFLPSIRLNNFYKKSYKSNFSIKYEVCYILKPIVKNDFDSHFHTNVKINNIIKKRNFFKYIGKGLIIKSYYEKNRYKNQINDKNLANLFHVKQNQINNNFNIVLESRVLVFDYLSTMIFEVINLNKPIIVIVNEKDQYLSNFGKIFFKTLNDLGILFPSYEKVIKFVKKNPNYFNEYARDWNKASKQNKIKKFCQNYASISNNYLTDWKNFLISK